MRGTADECIRRAVPLTGGTRPTGSSVSRTTGGLPGGAAPHRRRVRRLQESHRLPGLGHPSRVSQRLLRAGPHPPRRASSPSSKTSSAYGSPPTRRSPNRLDACVWAFAEPRPVRRRLRHRIRGRDLRRPGQRLLVRHRSRRRSHPDPLPRCGTPVPEQGDAGGNPAASTPAAEAVPQPAGFQNGQRWLTCWFACRHGRGTGSIAGL
jgi:hypothetical protein